VRSARASASAVARPPRSPTPPPADG
jgi:hypothetical protein